MRLERYEPKHLGTLLNQPHLAYLGPYLKGDPSEALAQHRYAYTGLLDGEVLFCAGLMEYWENRAEAWAVLKEDLGANFIAVHNMVKRFLEIIPHRRIEAIVDFNFEEGHRWVRALGFKREAPLLKHYRPDGGDCTLYVKLREN